MKKGRHRRYEEARELKRQQKDDIESLMDRLDDDPFERLKLQSTDSDETDTEPVEDDD
ncbi:MAG: hypothetical protein ACERLM_07890 [Acidimicrobiales bacterium]